MGMGCICVSGMTADSELGQRRQCSLMNMQAGRRENWYGTGCRVKRTCLMERKFFGGRGEL